MTKVITDSDEAEEYLYGMETVEEQHITSQSRWHTYCKKVVKSKEEKFYQLSWAEGSTEYQEVDFEMKVDEVEPYRVLVTKYRPVT